MASLPSLQDFDEGLRRLAWADARHQPLLPHFLFDRDHHHHHHAASRQQPSPLLLPTAAFPPQRQRLAFPALPGGLGVPHEPQSALRAPARPPSPAAPGCVADEPIASGVRCGPPSYAPRGTLAPECDVASPSPPAPSRAPPAQVAHGGGQFAGMSIEEIFEAGELMSQGRRSHAGGRRRCPYRGCKVFGWRSDMVRHIRSHTGEKPFKCTEPGCDKAFSQSGGLVRHVRIHRGEKPFACPFQGCSAAFVESGNLTRHMRSHTGERPFECGFKCGKFFVSSSHQRRHEQTHLGKSGKAHQGELEDGEIDALQC